MGEEEVLICRTSLEQRNHNDQLVMKDFQRDLKPSFFALLSLHQRRWALRYACKSQP